jgi:hypothetical protein
VVKRKNKIKWDVDKINKRKRCRKKKGKTVGGRGRCE